jgi:hypothetical protein
MKMYVNHANKMLSSIPGLELGGCVWCMYTGEV